MVFVEAGATEEFSGFRQDDGEFEICTVLSGRNRVLDEFPGISDITCGLGDHVSSDIQSEKAEDIIFETFRQRDELQTCRNDGCLCNIHDGTEEYGNVVRDRRERSQGAVGEILRVAISIGVPWSTIIPPFFPAPGPMSIIRSAAASMSRLCS